MTAENSAIKIYMREIGQTPLLTPEEERALAARIKNGDEAAKQEMIQANLRLVVKIARAYAQYGLPLLDLISEGNIGLMKAVARFDPAKGGKLSTYAAWWIKQTIRRALANQSKTIRLPAHLIDKISRMRRKQHELSGELGREPTNQEIARALDVTSTTVESWKLVALRPTSLDAPLRNEEGGLIGEIIADERIVSPYDNFNDRQLREEIEFLIDRLEPREQEILKYRYGLEDADPETLEVVGKRFKITRERVRQIQNSAVAKLREMMEESEPSSDK